MTHFLTTKFQKMIFAHLSICSPSKYVKWKIFHLTRICIQFYFQQHFSLLQIKITQNASIFSLHPTFILTTSKIIHLSTNPLITNSISLAAQIPSPAWAYNSSINLYSTSFFTPPKKQFNKCINFYPTSTKNIQLSIQSTNKEKEKSISTKKKRRKKAFPLKKKKTLTCWRISNGTASSEPKNFTGVTYTNPQHKYH